MIKLKYIINWLRLLIIEITILNCSGKRPYIINQSLHKRPVLDILRVKFNNHVIGILIMSKKANKANTLYINHIWVRSQFKGMLSIEEESLYFQAMFNLFTTCCVTLNLNKVALPINVSNTRMVEQFRRLITIHGFSLDDELTLEDVSFNRPYREQENITNVVYSRIL